MAYLSTNANIQMHIHNKVELSKMSYVHTRTFSVLSAV